jgi:hypothetical protein
VSLSAARGVGPRTPAATNADERSVDDRSSPRRRARAALAVVAGVSAVVGAHVALGVAAGGCTSCRVIEPAPLALDCSTTSTFLGELHFVDAASFRSFVADRCLPEATLADVDELVASVDFSTDGVFVARGLRTSGVRCIEGRVVDEVSVCDEGLRVVFVDEESSDAACNGLWTVAFSLPRAELRAALAEDPAADAPSAAVEEGDSVAVAPTF